MANSAQLVLLSGTQKGHVVPVKGEVSIGRHPESTIQFDDLQVSRRHARVFQKPDGVYIQDAGSGNGVYIGPLRIDNYRLSDGDIVRIGRQQIQFREASPASDKPAGKSTGFVVQDDRTSQFEAEKAENVYRTFFEGPNESITAMELRQIQKRLRAVYAANQIIAGEHSIEKVFDTIMGQIFSLVPAHNGLILLAQEEGGELNVEYVRSAVSGAKIQVSSSIIKRGYEDGEAIITSNAGQDSRFGDRASIVAENISSAMCAPLTHQGERLGVIYVDNHGKNSAFVNNDLELLVALAASAATAIKNARFLMQLEQAYQDTLVALANAIELRDHYTVGHTWRVTNFALEIAREMGWDEKKLNEVQRGGLLHDVGKIAVDNAILAKPTELNEAEFAQMKVHPERGADLLRDVTFLHPIIPYCLYHHERWDGTGYPNGLAGDDIPEEGRLIAVADTFDAMTSTRPYRKGMNPDDALQEIIRGKNTQFDPVMVDALERCYKSGRVDRILQDYFSKEARSIACPFCSTFIRFADTVGNGSVIRCNVCHKKIHIIQKENAFFGSLSPQTPADTETSEAKTPSDE